LTLPDETEGAILSAREIETLRWSALGKSTEEIADIIGRSAETARFHLKNAVRKLGANNRVHAIALASYRHLLGDLSGLH
jgi:DNA-binding CsgD family transcriptional regulator